ncbi:MAG TPA: hypothetical protein DD379_17435 [Cyanobacteria bacterium UBA11162]|nr:hypothetical protein [Cyanobacteria bacterium UBA11162]
MSLAFPQVNLQLHPGTELRLRLSLHNPMSEAMLLHPTLDDWVTDDDQIFSTINHLDPVYIYVFPGNEAKQTLSVQIPSTLKPGTCMKSWLRFPGVLEDAIPIQLQIVLPPKKNQSPVVEFPLVVTFPLSNSDKPFSNFDPTTAGMFGLMSGLLDLDKIPSRWLVAELLVILCQIGENYAQTQSGGKLLNSLHHTDFFKNGVLAFTSAQIPTWIANSISITKGLLNDQIGRKGLVYIWEQWLLSLAQTDLEAGDKKNESFAPPLLIDAFLTKLGLSAERWFGGIILGLALVSPQIAGNLNAIAQLPNQPSTNQQSTQVTYNLISGLPGLDTLPARWLVVELLLILAKKGDDYAKTEPGCQLLRQLSRTRCFKNGILAFASAQASRWLVISHSAASAYQANLGSPTEQGGLLYLGEQWLWSLIPAIKLSPLDPTPHTLHPTPSFPVSTISVSHSSIPAFVNELGMDTQRWFGAIILGLTLVSPRIAAMVEAIAAQAPTQLTHTPSSPVTLDDILQEDKPILR